MKRDDFTPTRDDVLLLEPGMQALNCFGRWREVTEIIGRGIDKDGRHFVRFRAYWGPNATMTGSYKENEPVWTVGKAKSESL